MNILIDTSVWIELFSNTSFAGAERLKEMVLMQIAVTCRPVRAELLSGRMTGKARGLLEQTLAGLRSADPDWNAEATWTAVTELAETCRRHKISLPGLVDRMILVCARAAGAKIWTLDKKLANAARMLHLLYNV